MRLTLLGVTSVLFLALAGHVNGESSAEAILKGLEKAAARETGIEAVTDTHSAPDSSDSEALVPRSFICKYASLVRHITIEYPVARTGYACRVVYDSEKGNKVPWSAKTRRDYCEPHALDLVDNHLELGWECVELY